MEFGQAPQGRVLGATLLIAGSCIGAAMLGLPIITGSLGFVPSCILLVLIWAFMVCTGLLQLEVNLWYGPEVTIISMAENTLGRRGRALMLLLFPFLFYSLLVAYIAGSGQIFADMISDLAGYEVSAATGSTLFTVLFGLMIYIGVAAVDGVNRVLMLGLMLTYFSLLFIGAGYVDDSKLSHVDWSSSLQVLPVMVISFGFHNLLPSLVGYLGSSRHKLRTAILAGSIIPLLLYIMWQWLLLGVISSDSIAAIGSGRGSDEIATHVLRQVAGSTRITQFAQAFAFFAIVTSFVGVALSLRDFVGDWTGFGRARRTRWLLTLAVLLPPYIFAFTYPGIFTTALKYAGALGAAVLFGVMPVLMVWKGRYRLGMQGAKLLPGGKVSLTAVMILACVIVATAFL